MADCAYRAAPLTLHEVKNDTRDDRCTQGNFQPPASLLDSIKTCGKARDLHHGNQLHAHILKLGLLDKDKYFGTALLHMYATCGALAKAHEVFDELPTRDVATWNALITGYAHHGLGNKALDCFERMQAEGISPSSVTYVCLLKACGSVGAVNRGGEIHAEVRRLGLLHSNVLIGTALVDMYAKCGALERAQSMFDEIPVRVVASWNALIFGYAQQGLVDDAVNLFKQMQKEGLSPDTITYVCILKVCASTGAMEKGEEIHAEVSNKHLLERNIVVGTALIDMYAKCGALMKAQEVFDKLQGKDVACWNTLIAGFARHGLGAEALKCYERMQDEGLSPSAITLVYILSACGSSQAIKKGEEIHVEVKKQRLLAENIVLGNAIIDMYAKCGKLTKAQEVFDELPTRDVASWNALISGYAHHGRGKEALKCFGQMQDEGFSPDVVTFICMLKACGSIGELKRGEEIHADISKQELLENHIVLGNALVDMYVKCGVLGRAEEVFDKILARDVTSWNVLIAAYSHGRLSDEAVKCFRRMQEEGISPNVVTFVSTLKACGTVEAVQKGKEMHARLYMNELLDRSKMLGNTLVDMYARCGAFVKALEMFSKLQARNVASWNALIAGYVQHGLAVDALNCFGRMQEEDFSPDAITFVSILKACASLGAVEKGQEIHVEIERQGLLDEHYTLGTALVDMYAKCGVLAKAQEVFDKLPVRDVVSWTALIDGYAQLGLGDEALCCYGRMRDEGLLPETVTFACILKACGTVGAIQKGEEVHTEVGRLGFLGKHAMVGYALVDMYGKCGVLVKAQEVFDALLIRDAISWTALISGYAQHGKVRRVFDLFTQMKQEHIEPNAVTFVVLLTACSHAGLVQEGQVCFNTMSSVYCIIPTLEHHACMVDLFSRAGHFGKAISMIEKVPPSDSLLLWSTVLGACRNWANAKLGKWAFEQALQVDEKFSAAYYSMSNICAAFGMLDVPPAGSQKWSM